MLNFFKKKNRALLIGSILLLTIGTWKCTTTRTISIEETALQYEDLGIQHKVQLLVWGEENWKKVVFAHNLPENYEVLCQVMEPNGYDDPVAVNQHKLVFTKDSLNRTVARLPPKEEYTNFNFMLLDAAPFWLGEVRYPKKLLYDAETNELIFDEIFRVGQTIKYYPENLTPSFSVAKNKTILPALPYDETQNLDETPRKKRSSKRHLLTYENGLKIEQTGTYFIGWRDSIGRFVGNRQKYFIAVNSDFPSISDLSQRIEVLQYICSSDEFQALLNNKDQKAALEKFWLDKAGSYERANVLSGEFYGRVEKSNVLFSTSKPGWTSDRGLIYTVFGPPDGLIKEANQERWFYKLNFLDSKENHIGFIFTKRIPKRLGQTDFILQRSIDYKLIWQEQQKMWQNGILN